MQQALIKLPSFTEGEEQPITFLEIPGQKAGTKSIRLHAISDSGRPVYYYIREGPAEITGDELRFTKIQPRAKFPVPATVVAWLLGTASAPKLKTAAPVERTFDIVK